MLVVNPATGEQSATPPSLDQAARLLLQYTKQLAAAHGGRIHDDYAGELEAMFVEEIHQMAKVAVLAVSEPDHLGRALAGIPVLRLN